LISTGPQSSIFAALFSMSPNAITV
jgi:hypothetical protein